MPQSPHSQVVSIMERPQSPAPPARRPRWGTLWCAVVVLGAFTLFTLRYEPGGSASVDQALERLTETVVRGPAHIVLAGVALLGSPPVSLPFTTILGGALFARGRRAAAVLLLGAMAALTIVEAILRVRLEAMPWNDLAGLLAQPRGRGLMESSYPSGHVARLVFLAGAVAALLPPRLVWRGLAVALTLGVLTALQRVDGGFHTGTDVVGGLLLGAGVAAAYAGALSFFEHASWATATRSGAPG